MHFLLTQLAVEATEVAKTAARTAGAEAYAEAGAGVEDDGGGIENRPAASTGGSGSSGSTARPSSRSKAGSKGGKGGGSQQKRADVHSSLVKLIRLLANVSINEEVGVMVSQDERCMLLATVLECEDVQVRRIKALRRRQSAEKCKAAIHAVV